MFAKVMIGLCVITLTCSGCGPVDNSVAVHPADLEKINTKPPPEKSAKGKPSFTKVEKD